MKKEYDVFWSYESRKQVDQVNELHHEELLANWEEALKDSPEFKKIAPLN